MSVRCLCKGCTKRYLGCHSTCKDYADYKAENAERYEKKAVAIKAANDADHYLIEASRSRKRRKR